MGRALATTVVLTALTAHAQLADGGYSVGTEVLKGGELEAAPGTLGDPLRAAGWFPGSREILSGLSPLMFDGMTPAASKLYFDGVELRTPAHAMFGPWALAPQWVQGLTLLPGVDSATRGRSLSRGINVAPRRVGDHPHASVRFDLLQLGGYVEAPIWTTTSEVQLAGRFFTGPFVASKLVSGLKAELYDYQARLEQHFDAGSLRLLVLGSGDAVGLSFGGLPFRLGMENLTADLAWRGRGRDAVYELAAFGALQRLRLGSDGKTTQTSLDARENQGGVRGSLDAPLGSHSRLRAGADFEARQVALTERWDSVLPEVNGQPGGVSTAVAEVPGATTMLGGAYGELLFHPAEFEITVGARADVWAPAYGETIGTIDPRITVEHDHNEEVRLRIAAGLEHQGGTWLTPIPALETSTLRFGVQEALRVEGGGEFVVTPRNLIRARAWGLLITNGLELSALDPELLRSAKGDPAAIEAYRSTGYAWGAELSWQLVDDGVWSARASYSFQQSMRRLSISRRDDTGQVSGLEQALVPMQYRQQHALAAWSAWRPGAGFTLALGATLRSGVPEYGGFYSTTQRRGVEAFGDGERWIPEDRDRAGTVGPWVRVDAKVVKRFEPGDLKVDVFLDVQNLSVWRQPAGNAYTTDAATGALVTRPASSPLPGPLPTLGVTVEY